MGRFEVILLKSREQVGCGCSLSYDSLLDYLLRVSIALLYK
jgi:hypothetical protein